MGDRGSKYWTTQPNEFLIIGFDRILISDLTVNIEPYLKVLRKDSLILYYLFESRGLTLGEFYYYKFLRIHQQVVKIYVSHNLMYNNYVNKWILIKRGNEGDRLHFKLLDFFFERVIKGKETPRTRERSKENTKTDLVLLKNISHNFSNFTSILLFSEGRRSFVVVSVGKWQLRSPNHLLRRIYMLSFCKVSST